VKQHPNRRGRGRTVDEVGNRHGKLVVTERSETTPRKGVVAWRCVCDCGGEIVALGIALRVGNVRSCGCNRKPHGMTGTVVYQAWLAMKARCGNPNGANYANYGARGITICDRWIESFENFLADMGERPGPGHSLDRIDPNGNYEPGNCRWATSKEQYENRRVSLSRIAGRTASAIDAVHRSRIPSYSRAEVTELIKRLRRDLVGEI
jgi:hypothetical protein